MNTHKLEDSSRLLDSLSWSAIAAGTVIALALQTVLLMLGLAFATSVGDHVPGGGFDVWIVLVQLCSLAVGAALTARLAHRVSRFEGMAAGVMTWAVALVLSTVVQGISMVHPLGGAAWSMFIGAIVSLAAAMLGGAFGARLASGDHVDEPPHPVM